MSICEMSMDVTQFVHVRSKSYFIIKHEGGSDSYQDEVTFDLKEQGHYVVSVSADFIKFLSFCPTEYWNLCIIISPLLLEWINTTLG